MLHNEPISKFMTRSPACIGSTETIGEAYRRMREVRARHLPVLCDGRLLGMISQRGLYRLETIIDVSRSEDLVTDAMDTPYAVAPGEPLGQVCEEMAQRRTGAAVVTERGKVVGIFTTTDALHVLSGLLQRRKPPHRVSTAR